MNLMSVYDVLPAFAQNMAFSYMGARIQRTRFGDGFHKKLAEFESHNAWSRDQLVSWRNDRLKGLVRHCYDTVPFYRDVMDEGGINPTSIQDEDSLKALPVIRKADVKANPKAFVSSKAKNLNILHVHTSGTTGSGFQFDSTVECQQAQFACFWRYYHSHGLDANMWQAQFSSRQAVPKRVATPPFWRIDKPGKRYYMSAFHESPANMRAYYEVIQEKRFPWISGYPSLMVLLAQWMNERDLRFDFVKAVTCGAENLLEYQADAMEKAFGVRPVQTYGQTENVAIFSQSPDGKILVDEDFSVVEFSPEPVGGVPRHWVMPFQLRNASFALRHGGYRSAGQSNGASPRNRFHRWPQRRLCSFAGRHESGKTRPRFQGYSAFSRGSDLPGHRLLLAPACCGGAVPMRRGRENGAFRFARFYWAKLAGRVRVYGAASSFTIKETALCGVGCGCWWLAELGACSFRL